MTAGIARTAGVDQGFRLADRGGPSPRTLERTLVAWFRRAAYWARIQIAEARRSPGVLQTRLRVAHGLPRPPGPDVLRVAARPALRASVRGELGVLRAAGVALARLDRRMPPGRVRADAAPARARPVLGTSGVVDTWSAGPGLRVLDAWSLLVRQHTVELSDGYVRALVKAIGEGIAKGGEWADIETAIEAVSERFGARVRLLARNEIAALSSAVSKEIQTQAGVKHFRWVHRGDDRVRESHEAAAEMDLGDGAGVFPWSEGAPGVGLYGENGYPGQILNCRCRAAPVLP